MQLGQQHASPRTILGKRRLYDQQHYHAAAPLALERLPVRTPLYTMRTPEIMPPPPPPTPPISPSSPAPSPLASAAGSSFLAAQLRQYIDAPLPTCAHPEAPSDTVFTLSPPAAPSQRVCEYMLLRPASVARCRTAPTDEMLWQLGCDGWRDDASDRVHFAAAAYEGDTPLLQLVDDDKQVGRTQALLTDMFFRQQQKQQQQMF